MLPPVPTPEALKSIVRDDAALREGVAAICARHHLDASGATRMPGGSVPVYAVGAQRVLKLFPPGDEAFAQTEWRSLTAVHARLPIPTPAPIATGACGDWRYVLMSRLHGHLLVEAWPSLSAYDRDRLATELGHGIAALHAIDPADPSAAVSWADFLRAQRENAVARQQARGLDPRWTEQIPDFLAATPTDDPPRALLHTELMREHLLVTEGADGWRLSGLFDFEPSMVGAPAYDLASFGVFVSCGDGRFLRRAMAAYGARPDAALQRRALAYAILHRYSNLRWYLERVPPGAGDQTLDDLARRWWSFDDGAPGG
ncbi:MAG: aminoglycoside 3'-phosphotransferase/choline kinase family protein [Polyangiales bacterium]